MLNIICRILLALIGAGALLIAAQAWMQPDHLAGQIGFMLVGDLGHSSFRADIGGFFAASGIFMLLAAVRGERQFVLPPLVLLGLALAGRLATAAQTGFITAYVQPITIEVVTLVVLLLAWTQFRRA